MNIFRKIIGLISFSVIFNCYSQTEYYKVEDAIFDKDRLQFIVDSLNSEIILTKFRIQPIVFHKEIRSDSVFNWVSFNMNEVLNDDDTMNISSPVYEQDSLYLYLNKPLPKFKLSGMNGSITNSIDLNGKPTLLDFWSVYCPPCIEMFSHLNNIKTKYGDKVNFLAIADEVCTESSISNLLSKNPFSFHIFTYDYGLKKKLHIASVPRYLFVDKNGILRYISLGLSFQENSDTAKKSILENNRFEVMIDHLLTM